MSVPAVRFFLWCAVTGEFDSDWHRTADAAERHLWRCGPLVAPWRVVALTDAQALDLFAVQP